MEELLREAGTGDDRSTEIAEYDTLDNDEILEEHEAKEVLSTMIAQKKKTFLQSLQTKRAKTLARGYGQWRDKGKDKGSGKGSMSTSGYVKGGYYKMTLSEAKAKSRCSKCKQVGHWHRDPECPHNQPGFHNKTKEVNYMVENQQSEEAIFCGVLDCEKIDGPSTTEAPTVEQAADFECFPDQLRQDQLSPGGSAVSANGDGSDSISVVYKDPLQTGVGCASLGVEGFRGDEYPVLWNETVGKKPRIGYTPNEDLCATIDTGCQRMAIGLNTLRRLDQALPPGLQATIVPQEHRFRSVHGTSTTKYVAAVPTSLGQRGSLLRPAIFETNASRDAPFLISLPFFMFCQAVLYLDPSTGLKVEFRKFHFTAPCHIGPTGSLRVSLANFSPAHIQKLQNAQEEFNSQAKEFEVFRLSSAFGPESYQSEPNCRSEVPSVSHGVARCHQEIPVGDTVRSSGGRTSMEADGAEASVHDLPDHGLGASAAHAKGEGEDASLLSMAAAPSPTPSYASQATEGWNHVTQEEIELMGTPPCCIHQVPCTLFMTRKQGPNFGRMFWRCPLPRAQQCRYFAWTRVQPNWKEPAESSASYLGSPVTPTSQRTAAPRTPDRSEKAKPTEKNVTQENCTHPRTTRAGTNAYVLRVKCDVCGKVLRNEPKRDSETESVQSSRTNKSKGEKKKIKDSADVDISKEEMAEYEEFQKFRQWQQHKKGSGSSGSNTKTATEP